MTPPPVVSTRGTCAGRPELGAAATPVEPYAGARGVVAAWLLAYYLLPDTPFARVSPASLVGTAVAGAPAAARGAGASLPFCRRALLAGPRDPSGPPIGLASDLGANPPLRRPGGGRVPRWRR